MAILKVTISLLKRQKAYAITIFCLTLLVSLMLSTVLTVIYRGNKLQDAAHKNANSPDMIYYFSMEEWEQDPDIPAQFLKLAEKDWMKSVSRQSFISCTNRLLAYNGVEPSEQIYLTPYSEETFTFRIKDHDDFILSEGEILFPLFYESNYSLKIGDVIAIFGHEEFRLAGFFEDPLFGSPMINRRHAYIHKADFDRLYDVDWIDGFYQVMRVNIDIDAEYGSTEYDQLLRDTAGNISPKRSGFYTTISDLRHFSMMLPQIILIILFSFAILSLLITLYVLRYAVLSSIEGNFITLGIYKALGFTGGQIRHAIMLQYTFVCFLGSIIGTFLSIAVTPFIGSLLMDAAGLIWAGNLWIPAGILVILSTLILIGMIALLNSRKIKKISPVRAIAFGRAPVYFAKRLNVPLEKLSLLPLNLRMAMKQMITRRKQYTALVIITALLTFMATFIGTTSKMFQDGDQVAYIFGNPKEDLIIMLDHPNPEAKEEILRKFDRVIQSIEEEFPVEKIFGSVSFLIMFENVITLALIYDTFEDIYLVPPISGRFPIYDNEIALSPVIAKRFDKEIGDTIIINDISGAAQSFIVTGMVQNMMEVGQNITLPLEAAKRIDPEFEVLARSIIFEHGTDRDAALIQIKNLYEDDDIIVTTTAEWMTRMIDSIQSVVDPATIISYGLTVVLIALITLLLSIIAIYRENTDICIFKSTGFTSNQLRLQFSLRFGLVALVGSLVGTILALIVSNGLISLIFGFFGVPKVHMDYMILDLLIPIVLICIIAIISAAFVSMRIRKVSGRGLIVE